MADFLMNDGNPGGCISAIDEVTGGVWYFTAPAKYLGDNSDVYGTFLTYDLKVTQITDYFEASDVIFEGAGISIWYDTEPIPGTEWTTYTVPLSETGWKTSGSNVDVTQAEFKSVLENMTGFYIRGEFNTGADTGYLDNVRFGAKQ